ncbi:EAL domain-containing protein [Propylenella binzhouense]|uniref:GGDEF domain-containing protein n=1 Tax=Propylenella binzhouense TaxID=2555902 RepID=A0A964WU42_9HYPH|nr:GGDEF domain-containing phosphodiesterase [Propylenella binzhouense]MYZ48648.1 GGDEF domain-containing protein [Propylenella binzhouense]
MRGILVTDERTPQENADSPEFKPDLTPVLAAKNPERTGGRRAEGSHAILTAIGEALYEWDLESDRLRWSENLWAVLRTERSEKFASGKAYDGLVDPESLTDRHQAVLSAIGVDYGAGVPYDVVYCLRLGEEGAPQRIWVQDRGVWFADETGRPALARGAIRLVPPARSARQPASETVPRRGAFLEQLDLLLTVAQHYRTPFVFALVSTENLRLVAEAYGAVAIGEMEFALAQRARQIVRRGDLVGWLSDTELGLMLRVADAEEGGRAVARISSEIAEPIILGSGKPIVPLTTVGAVMVPSDAATVQDCLVRARGAGRRARRLGPGRFLFHRPPACAGAAPGIAESLVAEMLADAVQRDRLQIARQPVVHASGRAVAFFECLARLEGPGGEPVAMADAIGVAEALGLMRLIDLKMQDLLFRLLEAEEHTVHSVNLSRETVLDCAWLEGLEAALRRQPAWTSRLVVEIPEAAIAADPEPAARFTARLRALGCRIAIDRFGASHTAFRNLAVLPVDIVKLDPAFVRAGAAPATRGYLKTLVDFAHHFRLEVVAGPIEEEDLAAEMCALGVDCLQGRHLGPPAIQKVRAGTGSAPALRVVG